VGEQTYNLQYGANLKTFGTFDRNTYTGTNVNVFGRYWDGKSAGVTTSFGGWKAWSGQDRHSVMRARAAPHRTGSGPFPRRVPAR
jgi:hypothetical protein